LLQNAHKEFLRRLYFDEAFLMLAQKLKMLICALDEFHFDTCVLKLKKFRRNKWKKTLSSLPFAMFEISD
jgi:hypothetical protein